MSVNIWALLVKIRWLLSLFFVNALILYNLIDINFGIDFNQLFVVLVADILAAAIFFQVSQSIKKSGQIIFQLDEFELADTVAMIDLCYESYAGRFILTNKRASFIALNRGKSIWEFSYDELRNSKFRFTLTGGFKVLMPESGLSLRLPFGVLWFILFKNQKH